MPHLLTNLFWALKFFYFINLDIITILYHYWLRKDSLKLLKNVISWQIFLWVKCLKLNEIYPNFKLLIVEGTLFLNNSSFKYIKHFNIFRTLKHIWNYFSKNFVLSIHVELFFNLKKLRFQKEGRRVAGGPRVCCC